MRRPRLFVLTLFLFACRCGGVDGQTLTPLWQFGSLSNQLDGVSPWSGLIQGRDGNFYGTAGGTGVVHCTVFKITPDGSLTPLWQFGSSITNADGHSPLAGLVQGRDGDFYGTTSAGGTNGMGTVFKITSAGTLTSLWQFGSLSNQMDGTSPSAGLIQGNDGSFYGTTFGGQQHNLGTVFRISPDGTFTSLYQFVNFTTDGDAPNGSLIQGSDGSFYGTTIGGGASGMGTVFKITSAGTLTTIWQFGSLSNNADGKWPQAGLVRGSDGNFYGMAHNGGANGDGTVFKITSAGTLTPLWQFGSLTNNADGGGPSGALIQGSDGNFYGATEYRYGSVFRITSAGTLTVLWQFSSVNKNAGGSGPMAGVVQGSDGNFYGTTSSSGTNDQGTVFMLTVPLNPPANQISSVCVVDTNIVLAIPSVAGETYQLQYRTDLSSGDWSNIVDACVSNSIGAALTVTNFGGALAPQGFYRFDITP